MSRLSSSITDLPPRAEVVVVGSGYGAAIAASRLARAGREVVILERGREFRPGEYPDTPAKAAGEMQFDLPEPDRDGRAHIGSATGLYDFRINQDINVFVGCGLGGTSLVNANVSLRAEPRVFQDPAWPAAIRNDGGSSLEESYRLAEQMLKPVPLPAGSPAPKLGALEKMSAPFRAGVPGARFYRPPINVNFDVAGANHVGVHQEPCNGCGDCVTGCNTGAKNTLLMNYLPDAWNHGAKIFTEVSVRWIERKADGWLVRCQLLGLGREAFDAPTFDVEAEIVILGAGTLGSTEILLRSREHGLTLSDRLGRGFTGNGDALGFAYNCDEEVRGVGMGSLDPKGREVGPCITGIIDLREQARLADGMVIEEGSIPGALAPLWPAAMAAAAAAIGKDTDLDLADMIRERTRELESLTRGPYRGAIRNTQTFLVMAHDSGAGVMRLDGDRLRIDWPGVGSEPVFDVQRRRMHDATAAVGGTFVRNPAWTPLFGNPLVTVHPLGGCTMADSAEAGVVDDEGRVFAAKTGTQVYQGLYVSDGSVIPRPLGVNPLLTICALAERSVKALAKRRGWNYSEDPRSAPPASAPAVRPGLRFTETMRGFWLRGATGPEDGFERGRAAGSRMEFTLTILSNDVERMLSDERHEAGLVGTVTAPALSPDPLEVSGGTFNLFVRDPDRPNTRLMRYRMKLAGPGGRTWFFDGTKLVRDDPPLDAVKDTTTLFIRIHDGANAQAPVLGQGILTIALDDFAKQLGTVAVTDEPDLGRRLKLAADFGRSFAGTMFQTYGGIFARPSVFDPSAPPRQMRPLRAPVPEIHPVTTADGCAIRLTRYRGGAKGPVILSHGLGVSSRIFSLDTIGTNFVEHLVAQGFDVWLLDLRVSIELEASQAQSTGDDVATQDYPAAVARVLEVTGAPSVQVVAHCWGSTTFFLAMLAGLKGVRSAVASQVATDIVAPVATALKTGLHVPAFLEAIGVPSLNAYVDDRAGLLDKLGDAALNLYPVGERCPSPVCHRITFMYAPLYRHEQLNDLTHETLHETFGIASMKAFKHLGRLVNAGRLVDADGRDVYLPHLDRLAIPIAFIHGEKNECFLPESTERALRRLSDANGPHLYRRHVIPGYGHIDCIFGRDAARDVYPLIVEHLEATR